MSETPKIRLAGMIAAAAIMAAGHAAADPVERYVALDVHNPDGFVLAMDRLQASDEMRGGRASLWGATFDGSSPTSHVLAIEYDDYADLQATDERVRPSTAWDDFLDASRGTNDVVALSLGVQRIARGSSWYNHSAAMVFNMTVRDPATYANAFTELVDSMDNPGSIRLIEMRAGGEGTTHLAIITAPDFVALNEYVDELFASRAYRDFVEEVMDIRRINTTSIYRRVKTWEN